MIGVELVTDRETAQPDGALAAATVYRAWELGAVLYYVGPNVLEITPPLTITDDEIDQAIDLVCTAITDAMSGLVDPAVLAEYQGW